MDRGHGENLLQKGSQHGKDGERSPRGSQFGLFFSPVGPLIRDCVCFLRSAFIGETGNGGAAISLCLKYLSVLERIQWSDFMRHKLEKNERKCARSRDWELQARTSDSEARNELENSAQ